MKLFECHQCGQLLFFENTRCERCRAILGYLPSQSLLTPLVPDQDDLWRSISSSTETFRFCSNASYNACNWLIPSDSSDPFCRACRLNRTLPDLNILDNVALWQKLEVAKHRLIYGLIRFDLPLFNKTDELETGLAFDFLSSSHITFRESKSVVTGHARGLITIDIAEADDAVRERHRRDMAEPYRTLLGHFRHEVGHYYWERLVRNTALHSSFQDLFGNETQNYSRALKSHYASGPQPGWQEHFVSAYASAHPWEDFAETWAHYLHIVDTLETAHAFGLNIHPRAGLNPALSMEIGADPYNQSDFSSLIQAWLPLTYAVNSLNHSMGQPDLYPFVLTQTVIGKLRFVHGLIHPSF